MENKKKKNILGIFNLFDIILIIIAIALAAAIALLSRDNSSGALVGKPQTQTEVRYTVELKEIENDAAESIKVGDKVIDRIKKYSIGTVESVEIVPARRSVPDEGSNVKRFTEVPNLKSAIVTIVAPATETDKDITVDGGYVIKTGMEVNARMPGFNAVGYIIDVERSEAK